MPVLFIARSEVGKVKDVAEDLAKLDEVAEVYLITGEFDILARLNVEEKDAIDLVVDKILKIDGMKETRTIFGKKVK
ncbi:MAG: Lrp/AsnC ligand binding domain-containing protein [Candidatus Hydrothermarchaeaceae archaeon]